MSRSVLGSSKQSCEKKKLGFFSVSFFLLFIEYAVVLDSQLVTVCQRRKAKHGRYQFIEWHDFFSCHTLARCLFEALDLLQLFVKPSTSVCPVYVFSNN